MTNKKLIKKLVDEMIIDHLELMEKRFTLADMKSPSSTQRDVEKVKAAIRERINKVKGVRDEPDVVQG